MNTKPFPCQRGELGSSEPQTRPPPARTYQSQTGRDNGWPQSQTSPPASLVSAVSRTCTHTSPGGHLNISPDKGVISQGVIQRICLAL